jgi:RNA polymerase sigma-70 factor (ECF subfamily)
VTADDPAKDGPARDDDPSKTGGSSKIDDPLEIGGPSRIAPAIVEALLSDHGAELKRFLTGVLRDPQLAGDALQNALVKMVERGHTAQEETRKAWLFRVAYNEALLLRRRQATGDNVLRRIAATAITQSAPADESILRDEEVRRVREALEELPLAQRTIVRMRIHDQKTFKVIAEELQIPLGTALSRMRSALGRLRIILTEPE